MAATADDDGELKRQRKENQAILQLLLIVGSFLFGYVPYCGKVILVLLIADDDKKLKQHYLVFRTQISNH